MEIKENELINLYIEYKNLTKNNVTYDEFKNGYLKTVKIQSKPLNLIKNDIVEYCGNCGQETNININGGYCEHCNIWLKPCSLCDMDKVDCSKCNKFQERIDRIDK